MNLLDRARVLAGLALACAPACSAVARRPLQIPPLVAHAPPARAVDIEHYALDVRLDPAQRALSATCRVRFYPLSEGLRRLDLDLVDLSVEAVTDQDGRALAYDARGGKLGIDFEEPLPIADSREVTVRYSGVPRRGLWFAGERDGTPTHVFTQGQCEDSRGWFPCWDQPDERATSELRVTLPPGWISFAAGEKVDSSALSGGGTVEVWRMTTPHPAYLTTLVAGELVEVRDRWDGVPLSYVAEQRFEPWLESTFRETPQVLEFFSELSGARYPFAKYAQVCVDNYPYGGMENISATTLTNACIGDPRGQLDYDPVPLIAHEAAHQWFGNLLTCADWSHVWLNEGLATYGELLYREATRGVDEFRAAVRDTHEGYLAADVGAERRPHVWGVYREPFDLFTRGGQTYLGSASRLHLLRFVVGDEAFFRGLKRYVAEQRGRAVVSDDFRRSMERESGLDLAPFFAQWFLQPGYPEFAISWTWLESRRTVRIDVEQVQTTLDGTPGVFTVPVDLEVRDENGARRTRVTIDERRESFELPAPSRPVWVVFDKYGWIPKRAQTRRSLEEWLALAESDDDVNGRRDALARLGGVLAEESGDDLRWKVAQALLARLGDAAPAVRVAAARSFARVYTPPENPIAVGLMRAASSDPQAAVRVAALETLAGWQQNQAFAVFGREQFEARFSWATMGAAALLVAKAEGRDALPWLLERLGEDSLHDALRAALLPAVAAVRGAEPIEILRAALLDERWQVAAREAAARQLATLARGRSDISREAARLLASTRQVRLQSALIELLGAIGDARAQAALREFHARSIDARQRRAIEAHLATAGT